MSNFRRYLNYKFAIETLKTILLFLVVIVLVLAVRKYIWYPVEVKGNSMETTLKDGDSFYVNLVTNPMNYKRYDVIVFKPYSKDDPTTPEDESRELYVKRIIAMPGETVTVCANGDVIVLDKNNEQIKLEDKYASKVLKHGINWNESDDNIFETVKLDEDEFLCLGDNREVSLDSRSAKIQGVHFDSILGRYSFKKIKIFK